MNDNDKPNFNENALKTNSDVNHMTRFVIGVTSQMLYDQISYNQMQNTLFSKTKIESVFKSIHAL